MYTNWALMQQRRSNLYAPLLLTAEAMDIASISLSNLSVIYLTFGLATLCYYR